MTQGNLGRWIEELDASIEKLQRRVDKIVAGGGFDPSEYVYASPFLDFANQTTTNVVDNEGDYIYTATAACAVVVFIMSHTDTCYIHLKESNSAEASSAEVCIIDDANTAMAGPYYLDAGQALRINTVGTTSGYIKQIPVKSAQLQEAPVGLLGSIVRKVKKVIKGGD